MRRKLFGWFPLIAGLILVAGCATTSPRGRDDSDMPWNTPQPWEGSPFFPGMERY